MSEKLTVNIRQLFDTLSQSQDFGPSKAQNIMGHVMLASTPSGKNNPAYYEINMTTLDQLLTSAGYANDLGKIKEIIGTVADEDPELERERTMDREAGDEQRERGSFANEIEPERGPWGRHTREKDQLAEELARQADQENIENAEQARQRAFEQLYRDLQRDPERGHDKGRDRGDDWELER